MVFFDIYLDRLPKEGVCMAFMADRQHEVEELQSVRSEVMDYYTPSRRGGNMLTYAQATDAERGMPKVAPAPPPPHSPSPSVPSGPAGPGGERPPTEEPAPEVSTTKLSTDIASASRVASSFAITVLSLCVLRAISI